MSYVDGSLVSTFLTMLKKLLSANIMKNLRGRKLLLTVFVSILLVGILVFSFRTRLTTEGAGILVNRGNYYFNGGAYDLGKAASAYEWALMMNDKSSLVHYHLARVYFVQGKLEAALREINEELALQPDFGKAYYVRGLVYGFMKRPDEAIRDFKKIIELGQLSETSWAVYNDLAWVEFQKGDFAAVEKTAKEGLARYPDNPWLLNSLGLAELNLEKKKNAQVTLENALNLAKKLTEEDVRRAYPGNDFTEAAEKRASIITRIQFNLGLVK